MIRKKIVKIFKDTNFSIDIITNLVEVNFIDFKFNLTNETYWPYKKPNDEIKYINVLSNYLPQIVKQLVNTIDDRYREIHPVKKCSTNLKVIMKVHWIKVVIKLCRNIKYPQYRLIITTKMEKEGSSLQSECFNKCSANLPKVNR